MATVCCEQLNAHRPCLVIVTGIEITHHQHHVSFEIEAEEKIIVLSVTDASMQPDVSVGLGCSIAVPLYRIRVNV